MENKELVISEELLETLGDGLQVEAAEPEDDIIRYDLDIISAHESVCELDAEEYDKGVKEVSAYIGQFHALINAGINSDLAAVVMSWVRDEKITKETNEMQVKLAKEQSVQIVKERI